MRGPAMPCRSRELDHCVQLLTVAWFVELVVRNAVFEVCVRVTPDVDCPADRGRQRELHERVGGEDAERRRNPAANRRSAGGSRGSGRRSGCRSVPGRCSRGGTEQHVHHDWDADHRRPCGRSRGVRRRLDRARCPGHGWCRPGRCCCIVAHVRRAGHRGLLDTAALLVLRLHDGAPLRMAAARAGTGRSSRATTSSAHTRSPLSTEPTYAEVRIATHPCPRTPDFPRYSRYRLRMALLRTAAVLAVRHADIDRPPTQR